MTNKQPARRPFYIAREKARETLGHMYGVVEASDDYSDEPLAEAANSAGSKVLAASDLADVGGEFIGQVQAITAASAFRQLKDLCDLAAQKQVAKARACGATWDDVAAGTGFSSGVGAAAHYNPKRRKALREASARHEDKWREVNAGSQERLDILKGAVAEVSSVARKINVSANKVSDSADSIQRSVERLEKVGR